jgi:hypothetical protein
VRSQSRRESVIGASIIPQGLQEACRRLAAAARL